MSNKVIQKDGFLYFYHNKNNAHVIAIPKKIFESLYKNRIIAIQTAYKNNLC